MAFQPHKLAILAAMFLFCVTGCDGNGAGPSGTNAPVKAGDENGKTPPLAHNYGSFVLVYDFKIATDASAEHKVDEAVVAIGRRIDPQGVAGLQFRNLDEGRLEVRGPMPPPEVLALRDALLASQHRLIDENVSRSEIEASLYREKKQDRAAAMNALAQRHPQQAKAIRAVHEAFEAHNEKRGPYADIEAVIEMLRPKGVLEFHIAPAPSADLQTYQDELHKNGPEAPSDDPYLWFEIDDVRDMVQQPEDRRMLEASAADFFKLQGFVGGEHLGKYYVLLSNQLKERLTDAEGDWRVASARLSLDHNGLPAIEFSLDATGAIRLGDMTHLHRGRMLSIVLDGKSIMIATIQSRIEKDGAISRAGGFTHADARRIVGLLNAGTLRVRLSPAPVSIDIVPAP